MFEPRRFLDLLGHFTVFSGSGSGVVKIIAGYHQYHAVRRAVESTVTASAPEGDQRIGVIWHTQGSGKSLLMAFYAGRMVKQTVNGNEILVLGKHLL